MHVTSMDILVFNEKNVRIRMKSLKKILGKGINVSRGDYLVFVPSGDRIIMLVLPRNAVVSKIRNNYVVGRRERFAHLLEALRNSRVESIDKIEGIGVIKMVVDVSKTIQLV